MNKYAPKKLKKGDRMRAIRSTYGITRHKLSKRNKIQYGTVIEKVTITGTSDLFKGSSKTYKTQNDKDEVYYFGREMLFVRKEHALNSFFSSIKGLLGENLSDFISKNKK